MFLFFPATGIYHHVLEVINYGRTAMGKDFDTFFGKPIITICQVGY